MRWALIPPVSGGKPDGPASSAMPPMQMTEHAALVRQLIDGAAILAAVLADANGFALVGDPARIHLDEKSAMLRLAPSRHVRSHGGRERPSIEVAASDKTRKHCPTHVDCLNAKGNFRFERTVRYRRSNDQDPRSV